jgi:hypothetical protein
MAIKIGDKVKHEISGAVGTVMAYDDSGATPGVRVLFEGHTEDQFISVKWLTKVASKKETIDWDKLPHPAESKVPFAALDYFLQPGVAEASEVRLHTAKYAHVIERWAKDGLVVLCEGWRPINAGSEGGKPMHTIAATLITPRPPENVLALLRAEKYPVKDLADGRVRLNSLSFVRRLLYDGQPNWKVTQLC